MFNSTHFLPKGAPGSPSGHSEAQSRKKQPKIYLSCFQMNCGWGSQLIPLKQLLT